MVSAKGVYQANSLVLSVGPWTSEILQSLPVPLTVSRRVMFWLRPVAQHSAFDKKIFPIFLWEPDQGPFLYGLPRIDEAGDPKIAIHHGGEECTPSTIDRNIRPEDEAAIRSAIEFRIPLLNGEVSHAATCMYTMTPDEHFIIDAHPRHPQVIVAAGFSGHGFKFSSVVGEILSDLAMTRKTAKNIALFSGSRVRHQ